MKKTALTFALVLALGTPLMAEDGERKRPSFEEMVERVAAHLMEKHPDLEKEEALRKASQIVKNKMENRRDGKKHDEKKRRLHEKFKHLVERLMKENPDLTEEQAKAKAKEILRKKKAEHDENGERDRHEKFKALVRKLMEEGLSEEDAIKKAKQIVRRRHGDHDKDGVKNKDEIREHLQKIMRQLKEEYPDLSEEQIKAKAHAILKRKLKERRENAAGEDKDRRDRMHAYARKLKAEGYSDEEIHKMLREKFGERKERREDRRDERRERRDDRRDGDNDND